MVVGGSERDTQKTEKEREILDASTATTDRTETLSSMPSNDDAQEIPKRGIGGHGPIQPPSALQLEVCEHAGQREIPPVRQTGIETQNHALRAVRYEEVLAHPSHRRKLQEQRPVESSDLVQFLSSALALEQWHPEAEAIVGLHDLREAFHATGFVFQTLREIQEVWRSASHKERERIGNLLRPGRFGWEILPLLRKNVPARVAKLRALGNAIYAPLAAEVIRAWMEARP
jgi:hypothetical protein